MLASLALRPSFREMIIWQIVILVSNSKKKKEGEEEVGLLLIDIKIYHYITSMEQR